MRRRALTWFVLRRLAMGVPVVWGVVTLLFLTFFVLPGDRVDSVMTGDRLASPEVRATVEQKLGLDEPLLSQYGEFWSRLATGDLGESFVTGQTVAEIIGDAAPASARLAFWAVVIEVLIGITAGVLAAVTNRRFVDALTTVTTALLLSVPVFVVGNVLQLGLGVAAVQHAWPDVLAFPVQGIGPDTWALGIVPTGEQWRYVLLPAVTLATASTAILVRLVRSSVGRSLRSDYVRGARAKGLRERDVVVRHALRNGLVPAVTFVGVDIAGMFGSAVVTETVFNWPGMGSQLARSLQSTDAPVILGLTLVLAIVYVITSIVADTVHKILDPRLDAAR